MCNVLKLRPFLIKLTRDDFEAIQNWTRQANFTVENAYTFSEASVVQMQNIARRYQQIFPTLLTETYSPERFHFRYTNRTSDYRTNSSTRAFVAGLFGENEATRVIYADIPDTDWLLRPFSFCPLFAGDRMKGSHSYKDRNLKRCKSKSTENLASRDRIGSICNKFSRCGNSVPLKRRPTLNFPSRQSETMLHGAYRSPSLIIFCWNMQQTWHYSMWVGTGLQNSFCSLAQDLLSHLQSDDEKRVRHFVAYGEQLQGFITTLGLFRDFWPMHRNNFVQQSARYWMSSLISPNAGHLAVILYE